jgi:flagellar biosynthesis protein FliR
MSAWLLVSLRLFALLRVQPHWRVLLGPWWTVLAGGLALVLGPMLAPAEGPGPPVFGGQWLVLAALELALGTVLGLVVALPAHALVGAVETSAIGVGLSGAPSRGFVGLALATAAATGLAMGLHRPGLAVLAASSDVWPVGRPSAWLWGIEDLADRVAEAAHAMTALALSLATPVLLAVAVVDTATRLVGRGPDPSSHVVDAVRPWACTAAALLALSASWRAFPETWFP